MSFKNSTKDLTMKLLKKVSSLIVVLSLSISSANANMIPLEDFLKETKKLENTIGLQQKKIELLERENKNLKSKLKKSKKKLKVKKNTDAGIYKVAFKETKVYYIQDNTKSPYSLVKDEIVTIEKCDNFGWCKLKDKMLLVKKHHIKKI